MIEGHIYIPRKGDKEILLERRDYFRSLSDNELIDSYNDSCSKGFFGSHGQALELLAKRRVFIERFNDSPIRLTDGVLIEFTGLVKPTANGWIHIETPE